MTVVNATIDVANIAVAFFMVSDIQMPKRTKLFVMTMFMLRLLYCKSQFNAHSLFMLTEQPGSYRHL